MSVWVRRYAPAAPRSSFACRVTASAPATRSMSSPISPSRAYRESLGRPAPASGGRLRGGPAQTLSRLVGEKRAREIVYLSRRYSATEALQMGLVNRVVPDDQLDAEVTQWCEQILRHSPQGLRLAKIGLNAGSDFARGSILPSLEANVLNHLHGPDPAEGIAAFRRVVLPTGDRLARAKVPPRPPIDQLTPVQAARSSSFLLGRGSNVTHILGRRSPVRIAAPIGRWRVMHKSVVGHEQPRSWGSNVPHLLGRRYRQPHWPITRCKQGCPQVERRGWDSNPRRGVTAKRFSRPPHSTALPPLRAGRYDTASSEERWPSG